MGVHGDHQTLSRSLCERRDTSRTANSCCIASLTTLHRYVLTVMDEQQPVSGQRSFPHLEDVPPPSLFSAQLDFAQ